MEDNYLESDIMEYVNGILDGVEQLAEEYDKSKENILKMLLNELNTISNIGW